MTTDDTARRLFDVSSSRNDGLPSVVRSAATTSLKLQPLETQTTMAPDHSSAEAEQALRGLEAEWAMRMEAPLSALANLEEQVSHAIDLARAALPTDLRTAAAELERLASGDDDERRVVVRRR
jgi:hypothetical protein